MQLLKKKSMPVSFKLFLPNLTWASGLPISELISGSWMLSVPYLITEPSLGSMSCWYVPLHIQNLSLSIDTNWIFIEWKVQIRLPLGNDASSLRFSLTNHVITAQRMLIGKKEYWPQCIIFPKNISKWALVTEARNLAAYWLCKYVPCTYLKWTN